MTFYATNLLKNKLEVIKLPNVDIKESGQTSFKGISSWKQNTNLNS